MFVGNPPGTYDHLLDFSRSVTGCLFFAPTATFLDDVDPEAADHKAADAETKKPPASEARQSNASRRRWLTRYRISEERGVDMSNLHRHLAPISEEAWEQIEREASRTLRRSLSARRVVDVVGPKGFAVSAVGTGHIKQIASPGDGVETRQREVKAFVELRVPFRSRAGDRRCRPRRGILTGHRSKKRPVRSRFAEGHAVFSSYAAAGIQGIREGTSNPVVALPAGVKAYPDAVANAVDKLRLAG